MKPIPVSDFALINGGHQGPDSFFGQGLGGPDSGRNSSESGGGLGGPDSGRGGNESGGGLAPATR